MVLDHLVIQNMDTTGKTVIAGKNAKKSEESFDKDELQTIIKFGAADLFKAEEDENEEKEKEVCTLHSNFANSPSNLKKC